MAKLANFTPDEVRWTHHGVSGLIKPCFNAKGKVDDSMFVEVFEARANFITTEFGKRGIVRMEFGDGPLLQRSRRPFAIAPR